MLSRMFLAGGREDVRVDVHMKRGVVKLFSPFFFGFVRNYDRVFLSGGKQVFFGHV